MVNYELRKRGVAVETSTEMAIQMIRYVQYSLLYGNKGLVLEAGVDENNNEVISFSTNYFREIAYNLEHTIHHMALIKIGIREIAAIGLGENYGVASSAMKCRRTGVAG
jgi:hypothetical protein